MKAYCHFINEDYKKVIEIYIDVFAEKKDSVVEYIRPFMETSGYAECATVLLRKMLEEFVDYHSFPQKISESIEKLFFPDEKDQKEQTQYLSFCEICRNDLDDMSSHKLSAMYLNNKNHYN